MQIRITRDDGSSQESSWALFAKNNADAFDPADIRAMWRDVLMGKTVTVGGGAGVQFSVERAPEPRP